MNDKRAFAPHCDQSVLHAPGMCGFCDQYPDWQEMRSMWGINYTGKYSEDKVLCPSEHRRPLGKINLWPGNRPSQ